MPTESIRNKRILCGSKQELSTLSHSVYIRPPPYHIPVFRKGTASSIREYVGQTLIDGPHAHGRNEARVELL